MSDWAGQGSMPSRRVAEVAERALGAIMTVRQLGQEPREIRLAPMDYGELTKGHVRSGQPTLWGVPMKSDPKVDLGKPRALARPVLATIRPALPQVVYEAIASLIPRQNRWHTYTVTLRRNGSSVWIDGESLRLAGEDHA